MKSFFHGITLHALVVAPGEKLVTAEEDMEALGFDPSQIKRTKDNLGLQTRVVSAVGTTATDLAFRAARHLLENTSTIPDVLIMVTQTPDYEQPGSGHLLHQRLQLPQECAVVDMTMGCSGFVYGLWLAYSLIHAGAHNVLLCCADTISHKVNPEDKTTRMLFGDAASAALICADEAVEKSNFVLKSDGSGAEHLWVPGGGARYHSTDQHPRHLVMNGAEVFNFSLRVGTQLVPEVLTEQGWELSEVDWFYLHQANHFILKSIAKRLKVSPEKVPMESFSAYGNLSSVSVPAALALHRQNRIIERPEKVLLAGFGVGLSWAGAAMTLSPGMKTTILS